MPPLKNITFFFNLLKVSIKESITNRRTFLVQASMMVLNNLIFFTLWWIFFRQFHDINGWTIRDLYVMSAIGFGAYGVMQVCFGELEYLSRIILRGDLDPFMTQPKSLLIHLIASRSLAIGWGDIFTAVLLIILGDLTAPLTILLIITSIFTGFLVYSAIGIIAHSLVFWLGSVENLCQKYCDSLLLFSLYPSNIYSGGLQVIMFTVIPAGIIGYLPVETIRNFTWAKLLILLGSSIGFMVLAFYIFYAGLKRYQSGNHFVTRL